MLSVLLLTALLGVATAVKNPIIPGWNPDPHIIRVGEEYFIATSTFENFPGTAIYRSTDLAEWELYSHAATRPSQSLLYGIPGSAGAWAPSLSHINGTFYIALMHRWVYDPVAKPWPRVYFLSSPDLVTWSDPVWCDPWGIDPHIFEDPVSRRTYLTLMSPNNDVDRVWGIAQCEVSLTTGRCVGEYRSLWNGTLEHNSSSRPEGPKLFYKAPWYYLLIAEGGTSSNHQATIARSESPEGPWTPAPNNPLVFNGQYGLDNLTVQSTGHATFVEGKDGNWFTSFLARRRVDGSDPLGRETFLASVSWEDGWPIINGGNPILLSEEVPGTPEFDTLPDSWEDRFEGGSLDISWYQLRTPYTTNFHVGCSGDDTGRENIGWNGAVASGGHDNCSTSGLTFVPNVYGLSDRDTPAAILRKQKSLNMTFSAIPSLSEGTMGPRQSVGISAYLSEFQHQDIGLRGCTNTEGICVYYALHRGDETETEETPVGENGDIPSRFALQIRAEPLQYSLGFSMGDSEPEWLATIDTSWLAYHPSGFSVFTGTNFALFASGGGEPWPVDGAQVGFRQVTEEYYEENIPDYDVW